MNYFCVEYWRTTLGAPLMTIVGTAAAENEFERGLGVLLPPVVLWYSNSRAPGYPT
jgi:hypothetical protein